MSQQDLEVEIKNIFRKSRLATTLSSRRRLMEILRRGFHELSLKDLLNLLAHMVIVMFTLVSALAKSLFKHRSA